VLAVTATVAAILATRGGDSQLETTATTASSGATVEGDDNLNAVVDGDDDNNSDGTDPTGSVAATEAPPSETEPEPDEPGSPSSGSSAPSSAPSSATSESTLDSGSTATTGETSSTSGQTSTTPVEETTSTTATGSTSSVVDPTTPESCWVPVLDEGFSGTALDTGAWSAYDSAGNDGHGLRRPSAVSVADGVLTITAQMDGDSLVSGGISHRYEQTYGRYEVRVRTGVDPSETMSGVVLTWPASNQFPRDGENDIYETLATPGDRSEFYSFIHQPFGTPDQQDRTVHPVDASAWHTVVMEWTPTAIRLYRDGALVKTLTETAADLVPDVDHFAAIQLDAWGDNLPAAVTMQVDHIKIDSYNGSC
jgi:hypothetical protein